MRSLRMVLLCFGRVLCKFFALLCLLASCGPDRVLEDQSHNNLSGEMIEAVQRGTISQSESHLAFGIRKDSYDLYIDTHRTVPIATRDIIIPLRDFKSDTPVVASYRPDFILPGEGALLTGEEGLVSWEVNIPEDSLYQLYVEYYPVEGKGSSIERQIEINGEVPFYDARHFELTRVWMDVGEPKKDNRENELRPNQREIQEKRTAYFDSYLGYTQDPFYLYFKKGTNILSFRSVQEPVAFTKIVLTKKTELPSYGEVAAKYPKTAMGNTRTIKFQAEKTYRKSDQMIYPVRDRSSAATEPYHHSKIRLNTIGGVNWKLPGQWITWEFDVEEEGLYKLAVRVRQNLVHGLKVNRTLMLDDKIPFKEAQKFTLEYSSGWQLASFGGKEDSYLFYLTPGRHTLTMESTLGDLGPILQEVEKSIYVLNYAYRKILMLTGPTPDQFRDYNIDEELPDVMRILIEQSTRMTQLADKIEAYADDRSHAAVLNRLSHMLKKMYLIPFSIPTTMKELKTNVGNLAAWVFTSREQPMELDYICFLPKDEKEPKARANIFVNTWYKLAAFAASFFEDYESVGNRYKNDEEALTVWVLSGRDQVQTLKRIVDDTFTVETGIPVNVKLVLPEVLLPATVAGREPDIAIQVYMQDPVNYAIRNAVVDLTQFDDYEEVAGRFHPSAMVPFQYQGGVYALPETQEFLMLFYRKDIFDELGIKYPETWDDLYKIMPDLQKSYMEFVVPIRYTPPESNYVVYDSSLTYNMFLFQKGGSVYRRDGIAVGIDSELGIAAFKDWTDLFVNYKLPDLYDFRNRFRVGEQPIGIARYTEYNVLKVFAPEIQGLWGFVPVPGTIREDGKVDRSVPATGYATVMMETSEQKDDAWTFLKWWYSTDTQVRYGKELESIMGPAARHPTANMEAMRRLAWPVEDYRSLLTQWEWVKGVPEVPGSYYLPRHVDNAWRNVYYSGHNPRNILLEYARKVNEEITSKRKEFGLHTLDDLSDEEKGALKNE